MDKSGFYKMAAGLLFLAILFTPQGSKTWFYLFVPGIIFGVLWFWKLD